MQENPAAPESRGAEAPEAAERSEVGGQPEATAPPDVPALVATCFSLLAARAWAAMGLIADPVTGRVERNLDHAQLAIDAAGALADVLRPRVGDAERRELERVLADLRLNFVEQKSRPG
ncbi:MAG: DUF1844 domain-containing protein [Armatimonadota bacterium]|nr:DUF1844 domain-containing protein [Armatimonadota bacterium]MDR7454577.1 DUF1844 domain-containing protein [Armatimonadota bacterium]MDR7495946.1 DUF1844 domain-containing protein [Armatimonadota bacterium]MDR7511292.1 DUF1844 domain-containing protein [Armatimonadota bacterium]